MPSDTGGISVLCFVPLVLVICGKLLLKATAAAAATGDDNANGTAIQQDGYIKWMDGRCQQLITLGP